MNEMFETLLKLIELHNDKFDYYADISTANIGIIVDKALLGEIDDSTLELKKLLEDSIKDGIDYLPKRYNYNAKDIMGDINNILIDYYDH
ncbi:MAG: hypothetical protein K2L10_00090 [Ruminococcus sp.]|nr:hypothetical protein [Ruminococcus sp.]